jgi:hypothetical protein
MLKYAISIILWTVSGRLKDDLLLWLEHLLPGYVPLLPAQCADDALGDAADPAKPQL